MTISRRCIITGCRDFAVPGTSRCPRHPYKSGWGRRPSSTPASAYRGDWPERRASQLKREQNCRICGRPATQVDHIIANQHGGSNREDNLCLCCIRCNLKKGPNIASVHPDTRCIVELFHPRKHLWSEHFVLESDRRIRGLTPARRATVQLLGMNDAERLDLRRMLVRKR